MCPASSVGNLSPSGGRRRDQTMHHAWCRPAPPTPGAVIRAIQPDRTRYLPGVSRRTLPVFSGTDWTAAATVQSVPQASPCGRLLASSVAPSRACGAGAPSFVSKGAWIENPADFGEHALESTGGSLHSSALCSKTGRLASNMPDGCDTRGDDGAGCSRCHHGDGDDEHDYSRRISYASTAYRTRVSLRRRWGSRRGCGPRPACHHAERRFSRSVCQSHGVARGFSCRLSVGLAKSCSCVYAYQYRHTNCLAFGADRTHGVCDADAVNRQRA